MSDMAIFQRMNRGNNHSVIDNCWPRSGSRELLELLECNESR